MTGPELRDWADRNGWNAEDLANKLGVSKGTVYIWFRSAELDKVTVLALAQIGYTAALPAPPGQSRRAGTRS
jgi:transcriptional regulator with XRE-family HTH domain